jgi:outer membrane protein OmpA-like peptidoglycan-associated protein
MQKQILTTVGAVVILGLSHTANAATPAENRGVIGGALIGAVTGGPVGLIAGAALGGHYAHKSGRAKLGALEVERLNGELAGMTERLAAVTEQSLRLAASLEARESTVLMQSKRIDALLEDQSLLTSLGLEVRFATDDAQLAEADRHTLETLARYLERHPQRRVRLHGHADARGGVVHNDKLSLARSHAVADALKSASVDPRQIDVLAYGERQADAAQSDPDRLAAERKVDVELVQPGSDARSASSRRH